MLRRPVEVWVKRPAPKTSRGLPKTEPAGAHTEGGTSRNSTYTHTQHTHTFPKFTSISAKEIHPGRKRERSLSVSFTRVGGGVAKVSEVYLEPSYSFATHSEQFTIPRQFQNTTVCSGHGLRSSKHIQFPKDARRSELFQQDECAMHVTCSLKSYLLHYPKSSANHDSICCL